VPPCCVEPTLVRLVAGEAASRTIQKRAARALAGGLWAGPHLNPLTPWSAPMADEEITLDEDWDWHLRGGPDRNRGAVLIPGADCCCGRTHTRDYTPAKARRIAARLIELADEAEKVEPAPLVTPEEANACCGDPSNRDGNAHPWREAGDDNRGSHYVCLVCGATDTD
jgi:hypothetical protein